MLTRLAAATHRGLVRERNEDNYLIVNVAAETCGSLVTAANAAGGQDNITCCAVRFANETIPSPPLGCCQPLASKGDKTVENPEL